MEKGLAADYRELLDRLPSHQMAKPPARDANLNSVCPVLRLVFASPFLSIPPCFLLSLPAA
jgi:hypothetical protein